MSLGSYTEQQVLDLARRQYEQGVAQFTFQPKTSVLLVIDMQEEFVKPHWTPYWIPEATRIIPRIKQLIDLCRKKKIPVIYTVYSKTHHYLDRPPYLSTMPSRQFDEDIDQSTLFIKGKVPDEIAPHKEDIIIHKSSYGAFYETPLETILKNLEKDTVIISGTLTNYCCSMTARQAYERGFKVIFGSDVTATHFPEMHTYELQVLRRGFAKILSLKEIHDAFNATSV
jgi:nicotinamidase-related amidase